MQSLIMIFACYNIGLVYAVGGFNGSLRVKTVDEYDPNLDTWTSIASMEARRSTLGVAVLNNRIYAVGGFDGSTGLNTAEVLDLSSVVPTQHSGKMDLRIKPLNCLKIKWILLGIKLK